MEKSPLSEPTLFAIEEKLNEARFDDAQRLLAELPDVPGARDASVYFATRLLFQRGRLDRQGVVDRLRELLRTATGFPEAERMLEAAERGVLERGPEGFARTTQPPAASLAPQLSETVPPRLNAIPRAPLVPEFSNAHRAETPPASSPVPSYARETLPVPPVARPSPFQIADALDRGKAQEALALTADADETPELALLRARALIAVSDHEAAELSLSRLLRAPLLEPSLRTGAARLLLELGSAEEALQHARRALADDPDEPSTRVTCAWAQLRVARRTGDAALARDAERLLASVRLRDRTFAAVLPALRAHLAIEHGDADRARALAQTALSIDPRQTDALAALALSAAKLGLYSDAERAWARLSEASPRDGSALVPSLEALGLSLGGNPRQAVGEARVAAIFGDAEAGLTHGRPELAVLGFERACGDRLRALSRRGGTEAWPMLASGAARLFTELPVLRHFAPYDCSVFSVERLAAAFDVLYASGQPRSGFREDSVALLAGAYVGESLRQAFGGEWHGDPKQPLDARVEAIGFSLNPCERVARRLRDREPLQFDAPMHLHPGADPFGNSVPLSLAPPSPWDPEPWPSPARVPELGRALPKSIVGWFCRHQAATELDHSLASVVAIDRYLALLSPLKAPPSADTGWTHRVAVLLGAYIGEVLVDAIGARWVESERTDGAQAYRLALRDGSFATPVARVIDRLSGRRLSPLSDYVTRLSMGRPSLLP